MCLLRNRYGKKKYTGPQETGRTPIYPWAVQNGDRELGLHDRCSERTTLDAHVTFECLVAAKNDLSVVKGLHAPCVPAKQPGDSRDMHGDHSRLG